MGKGRKHRHIDRNAHAGFGKGASRVRPQTMGRRPGLPVMLAEALPPPSLAGTVQADARATPALPLPAAAEPLVVPRQALALPPRTKSKYPAKKAKRPKWSNPLVAPRHDPVPPPAVMHQAADAARLVPVEAKPPRPLLLLTYQPRPVADPGADDAVAVLDALLAFDPFAIVPTAPTVRPAPQVLDTPAAHGPLPRGAAVTRWKRAGPFDMIGYWLRRRARSLGNWLVSAGPSRTRHEIARLRAENAELRHQLRQLEALQG